MGGISETTRGGLILHAQWRREGSIPPEQEGGRPRSSEEVGDDEEDDDDENDEGLEGDEGGDDDEKDPNAETDVDTDVGVEQADVSEDNEGNIDCDGREEKDEEGTLSDRKSTGKKRKAAATTLATRKKQEVGVTWPPVNRDRPKTLTLEQLAAKYPPGIVAAARRAQHEDVRFHFPQMERQRFETFADFEQYVTEYFARLYGGYRRRSSITARAHNETEREARETAIKAGKPAKELSELLPCDADTHYRMVMWCVHGCTQTKRGRGVRSALYTRYTGCAARLTGVLESELGPNGERVFFVRLVNEYSIHNHHVSATIFKTYCTTADLVGEDELYEKVAWAAGVGGDPRIVRDLVSRVTGMNYSQQKYDNLLRYWLGGEPVLKSLQALIEAFAALPGYRCLVIKDATGMLVGLVFQSAYQRAVVRAYGDTFTMDWTHNTNNRGFHQGAVVATTANGTSVPVLDFLCLSQSNKMLEAVFTFFIEHNPSVTETLKSMVIDKDFGEWRTCEKMFPHTVVVLCIFHMLQWFKLVVTQVKYSLDVSLRDDVLACLRGMVYAVSADALAAQKNTLRQLLSPETNTGHQAFLTYMETNWYAHSGMWSHAERGCTFTAGNTTSNRVESLWCSYKATLGHRRRLDLCVEAIFQHATMILRREEESLTKFVGKTALHQGAEERLRLVLLEVSAFTAKKVQAQWTKYLARHSRYRVLERTENARGVFTLRYRGTPDVDFEVDTSTWTCSCRSHRSIDQPCRHLFFVALDVLHLPVFPVIAVRERWRMSEALKLLPTIQRCIAELEQLRVRLVLGRTPANPTELFGTNIDEHARGGEEVSSLVARFPAVPAVALVHLAKHEVSDSRVRTDQERRNRFDMAVESAQDFAASLSSRDCETFTQEAAEAMATLVTKWKTRETRPGDARPVDADLVDPSSTFDRQTADRRVVLEEIERDTLQTAWRAIRAPGVGVGDDDDAFAGEADEEEAAGSDSADSLASASAGSGGAGAAFLAQDVLGTRLVDAVRQRLIERQRSPAGELLTSRVADELLRVPDPDQDEQDLEQNNQAFPVLGHHDQLSSPATSSLVDAGVLKTVEFTIPPEKGKGIRRTTKQLARPGRPGAHVGQTSKVCPLTVRQFNVMVRFCAPLEAATLQARMPVVLTESTVLRRTSKVLFQSYTPRYVEDSWAQRAASVAGVRWPMRALKY